jgi:L-threonylcarbamoyladenylate synthase
LDDLDGRIDAVLDAGPTVIGVESTVLDLTVCPPAVLRPGGTSFEALKKVLPRVELSPVVLAEKLLSVGEVRSPGVKYKHYAPKADVVVVEGELGAVVERVKGLVDVYRRKGSRVGVLCTDETEACYGEADVVLSLGSRSDLAGVAHRLFGLLREFDCEKVDVVVAEGLPVEGIGLAVVNRLRKAAGYKIIKA